MTDEIPEVPPVPAVAPSRVRKVAPPVAGVMAAFFVLGWLWRRKK